MSVEMVKKLYASMPGIVGQSQKEIWPSSDADREDTGQPCG